MTIHDSEGVVGGTLLTNKAIVISLLSGQVWYPWVLLSGSRVFKLPSTFC